MAEAKQRVLDYDSAPRPRKAPLAITVGAFAVIVGAGIYWVGPGGLGRTKGISHLSGSTTWTTTAPTSSTAPSP